jgi:hypothetical protein
MKFTKGMCVTTLALLFLLAIPVPLAGQDNQDRKANPLGNPWVFSSGNYITAKPQDRKPKNHDARDCKIWYRAVQASAPEYDGNTKVYPYLEFITKKGARIVQTNEDGPVLFSDDVECWKSGDRFPPF